MFSADSVWSLVRMSRSKTSPRGTGRRSWLRKPSFAPCSSWCWTSLSADSTPMPSLRCASCSHTRRHAGSSILVSGHVAEQSFDTYRTLQLVDGKALELPDQVVTPPFASVTVTLVDPIGRLDRQVLVALPGVFE